jgi:dihydroxy-acid dehydratase
MKALLDAGLLHGDVLTVTGRTMAENLADIAPPDVDGKVLRAMSEPLHRTGGLTILHGSLVPDGAVVKSADFDTTSSRAGPGSSTVSVVRWTLWRTARSPRATRSSSGMSAPRAGRACGMLPITGAIKGAGLDKDVLLVTARASLPHWGPRQVHQAGRLGNQRSCLRLSRGLAAQHLAL